MQPTNLLRIIAPQRTQKPTSALVSEKFAIVTCGLLIAVVAIPSLVVIQALAAIFSGITTVFELLNGNGLFNEGEDL
ncbi:MAG TPA: hypothetical protein V6D37_04110 [Candidatus Sericytochromatia bacterium]|jgi:hypothetical protein